MVVGFFLLGLTTALAWTAALIWTAAPAWASAPGDSLRRLRVFGTVNDSQGAPVVEGRVELRAIPPLYRQGTRWLELGGEGPPAVVVPLRPSGRFDLVAPRPGFWQVVVHGQDFESAEILLEPLLDHRALEPLTLRRGNDDPTVEGPSPPWRSWVTAAARASGTAHTLRIQESDGRPARQVFLFDPFTFRALARTGAAGQVEWPLGLGDVVVLAARDGRVQRAVLPELGSDPASSRRLTLRAQIRVWGRVMNRQTGEPVPRAWVWTESQRTRADEGGKFSLWVDDPAVGLHYHLAASGYVPRRGFQTFDVETPVEVDLHPAASVRGQVKDFAGSPLAGVEVRAWSVGNRRIARRTWSDEKGGFHLGPLPSERGHRLEFSRQDLRREEVEVEALDAFSTHGLLRLTMGAAGLLVGRVVNPQGQSIPEAEVSLEPSPLERGGLSAGKVGADDDEELTSDDEGWFASHITQSGLVDLEVVASGYAPLRLPGLEVDSEAERVDLGDLILEPAALIRGRIFDSEGSPLSGAEVYVFSPRFERTDELGLYLRFRRPSARSTSDGRFAVDGLAAGAKVNLVGRRSGHGMASVRGVEAPTSEELRIVLESAARVAGQVVDGEGLGLEGIDVYVRRPLASGFSSSGSRSRTRAGGTFEFRDVAPGPIELWVQATNRASRHVKDLEVPEGEDLEGVEILLEVGGVVTGRIFDALGQPVAKASVRAFLPAPQELGIPREEREAVSDAEGHYQLTGLSSGRWRLVASRDRVDKEHELEVDEGFYALDFTLGRGGEPVRGVVLDDVGAPAAGVLLRLLSLEGERRHDTVSSGDGTFRFPAVGAGTYRLVTGISGERVGVPVALMEDPGPIEVDGDPEGEVPPLEVRVGGGATVVGKVHGLTPAERLVVELEAQGDRAVYGRSHVRLDAFGGYEIRRLGIGRWTLTARLPGTGRRAVGEVVVDAQTREAVLDLDFGSGLSLEGSVLAAGEPVTGAMVTLSELQTGEPISMRTDYRGRFAFEGLETGPHRLVVRFEGMAGALVEEVDLWSDREIFLEIQ